MTNSKKIYIILVAFLLAISNFAGASNLTKQKEALDIISVFAEKICSLPPLSGQESQLVLSGEAKAELSKVLKKVTDLGIHGAATYQNRKYQGVLQNDIASLIKNSSGCRLEVLHVLSDKLLVDDNSTSSSINKKVNNNNSTASIKFPIESKMIVGQTSKFFNGLEITIHSFMGGDGSGYVNVSSAAFGKRDLDFKTGVEGPTVNVDGQSYVISFPSYDSKTRLVTIKIEKLTGSNISFKKN